MKRILFEFLFIVIYFTISVLYFYKENYWFALILIIPVGAMIIDWAMRDDIADKKEMAK